MSQVSDKARALRGRAFIDSLKAKPCMDCHGTFEPCQMEFDHRDYRTKLYSIADLINKSEAFIMAEVAKCDLVCANCHRLRTHRRGDQRPDRSPSFCFSESA